MQSKLVQSIRIKNFKSARDLKLDLGQVNVFIGENGAGKSNILEAIAFAAAAAVEKVDNEFLASRGIRVTEPALMQSAFEAPDLNAPIEIDVSLKGEDDEAVKLEFEIHSDSQPYPKWIVTEIHSEGKVNLPFEELLLLMRENLNKDPEKNLESNKSVLDILEKLTKEITRRKPPPPDSEGNLRYTVKSKLPPPQFVISRIEWMKKQLGEFVIYSPENSALRTSEREGQILPLGINGEGLSRFLQVLNSDPKYVKLDAIRSAISLFGWASGLKIERDERDNCLRAKDKYLAEGFEWIDQRSTNEGFLFAAFYFSLFASDLTPRFFAVDNIDAALNPKLCEEIMKRIASLAKLTGKQCILTTHNPAILDGLDITDPEQRLFIVSRSRSGRTVVRRFDKTPDLERKRLSELFISGLLGGIPKGF